jgi:hypothetical protein
MSFPEGYYKKVYVHDPLGGGTLLRDGTGTSSSIGVFACGKFTAGDYPKIGQRYKITGEKDGEYHEDAMPCITSNHQTCEFKD